METPEKNREKVEIDPEAMRRLDAVGEETLIKALDAKIEIDRETFNKTKQLSPEK